MRYINRDPMTELGQIQPSRCTIANSRPSSGSGQTWLRNHETIRRPELSMDVAMTEPHLGAEQRRALQMLASARQNGATEAFMLAHGGRACARWSHNGGDRVHQGARPNDESRALSNHSCGPASARRLIERRPLPCHVPAISLASLPVFRQWPAGARPLIVLASPDYARRVRIQ